MGRLGKHAAFIALALLVFACSDNRAVRLRYDIEKQLFRAEQTGRQMQSRPELIGSPMAARIRERYGQIVTYCYAALDSVNRDACPVEYEDIEELTFRAATRLSQLFFAEENYDTCTAITNRLLTRIHLSGIRHFDVYYSLGRSLQAAGHWDSALAVYRHATENIYPPADERGTVIFRLVNLPYHLYGVVVQTGGESEKALRFHEAETYYQRLIQEYASGDFSTAAHANLARLYSVAGRHERAVAQLRCLWDSPGDIGRWARLRTAETYAIELGKPDSALRLYDDIELGLAGRDTLQRPEILFRKGLAHSENQQYSDARSALLDLKNRYPKYYAATAAVQQAIALSFEREGNWTRAETEYRFLIDNYPSSEEAMSAYLYLARYLAESGRTREADILLDRAAGQFDDIAMGWRGTPKEAVALGHKAELYRHEKRYAAATEMLLSVFEKSPQSATGRASLLKAARICAENLDNQRKADSLINILRNSMTEVDDLFEI